MGLSNFFDNFIGGLAFGMLSNSPFFSGMGYCNSYGFGIMSTQRVDFETFANPFPNPFANMNLTQTAQPISILNDFANPNFPTFDFSLVGKTIWDNVTNPDSDYNKNLRESISNNSNSQNQTSQQTSIQCFDMPFSPWYLPTQFNITPIGYYNPGTYIPTPSVSKAQQVKPEEKVSKKADIHQSVETDENQLKNNDKNNYDITALKNKWSKKKDLPNAFYEKVIHISRKINCDPNDLMAVMWVESDHSFSPSAKNPHSTATGLIQFTTSTARRLGTSIEKLKAMTAVEQLDYVEKYLIANKASAGYNNRETLDRGTLYSLVFLPARSKRTVLTAKGENYYEQNIILDYNKDGKITKADLNSVVADNLS